MLSLTKEVDIKIITLLNIVDLKGVQAYLIETLDGRRLEVHSHNLAHLEDPDMVAIPLSASDYVRDSHHISKDQAQHVEQPKKLSPLIQRFLSWHECLNHFPEKIFSNSLTKVFYRLNLRSSK